MNNTEAFGLISSDFVGSMLCTGFKQLLFIDRYISNSGYITNVYTTLRFRKGEEHTITTYHQFDSLFSGVIFLRSIVETE